MLVSGTPDVLKVLQEVLNYSERATLLGALRHVRSLHKRDLRVVQFIKNWWEERIVRASPVSEAQWQAAFDRLPVLARLSAPEQQCLRRLAILFLHKKSLEGAGDLVLDTHMGLIIALQACLPILNLGLQWYQGWVSVIVYPQQFAPLHTEIDATGVVHQVRRPLQGESWLSGPVVLSWENTEDAGIIDGHNLVIHEFAHKLDMLNGAANGFPPLHREMSRQQWQRVFSAAFEDFQRRVESGHKVHIDRYGAESPAEFFAVLSELFFEQPHIIHQHYPQVYELLSQFYKQHPLDAPATAMPN
jgi:Mlc titration factor MtfA (ptsG expression regulator)